MKQTRRMCGLVPVLAALAAGMAGTGLGEEVSPSGKVGGDGRYGDLPLVIRDEGAGDWVVDRFAGNSTAGTEFYQGPAREVGGIGRPGIVRVLPDGAVCTYVGTKGATVAGGVAMVETNGTLVWVKPHVMGEYDAKEQAWYSIENSSIKRIAEKPDGTVTEKLLAGTPGKDGSVDGPGATALISKDIRGAYRTASGIYYWLEGKNKFRKFQDGTVTTPALKFKEPPDGFALIMSGKMFRGENDDTLYVADCWNFRVCRIDLKGMEVVKIAGMPKPEKGSALAERFGRNADGPALTRVAFNSGAVDALYDPFHEAIWVGGPDEDRLRWLKDGWVKTVIGGGNRDRWPLDAVGVPADKAGIVWTHALAVDRKGGVYFMDGAHPSGLWRACSRKEAGK